MKVRGGETDYSLWPEMQDTAPGSQMMLAQVCVAAGGGSLLAKAGLSVPQDLL